jgi:hypothetical protein
MELPSTTEKQREPIYEDVRQLISPGFLVHYATVNGVRIALRSLNRSDTELLRHRLGGAGVSDSIAKNWTIASSVWMIDGQIILGDEGTLYRVYQMVSNLPTRARDDLYAITQQILKKLNNAVNKIEAYLYESESRYLWKSVGLDLVRNSAYGRSAFVGSNSIQGLWVFYNQQEDDREYQQSEWSRARFLTSPHAPKAIKKIAADADKTNKDVEVRRQGVMDRTYYEATGAIPRQGSNKPRHDDNLPGSPWQGIRRAETREELAEDMRRWVLGIKDDHDNVVDGIKARIKQDVEERRRLAQERSEAVRKALEAEGVSGGQLQPLTGQAAKEFMERVSSRIPGAKKVVEGEGYNRAYEKYIAHNPEIGNLKVDESGQVVPGVEIDEKTAEEMLEQMREPKNNPRDIGDLQRQIADRRPTAEDLGLERE